MDYSVLELLGDVGGLLDALLVICGIAVYYFADINMNIQTIGLFSFIIKQKKPAVKKITEIVADPVDDHDPDPFGLNESPQKSERENKEDNNEHGHLHGNSQIEESDEDHGHSHAHEGGS